MPVNGRTPERQGPDSLLERIIMIKAVLRPFLFLAFLVALAVGLAIGGVAALQTPWGTDRLASVLRGAGWPIDGFRVTALDWRSIVIEEFVADDGRLTADRVEVTAALPWPQLLWARLGADRTNGEPAVHLSSVQIAGLDLTVTVAGDGTIDLPLVGILSQSDEGTAGTRVPVVVDRFDLQSARVGVQTPFGLVALAAGLSGSVAPDRWRGRADGVLEANITADLPRVGGVSIDSSLMADLDGVGPDGTTVSLRFFDARVEHTGNRSDTGNSQSGAWDSLSDSNQPTRLIGGDIWLTTEFTPGGQLATAIFRAEAEMIYASLFDAARRITDASFAADISAKGARASLRADFDAPDTTGSGPAGWVATTLEAGLPALRTMLPMPLHPMIANLGDPDSADESMAKPQMKLSLDGAARDVIPPADLPLFADTLSLWPEIERSGALSAALRLDALLDARHLASMPGRVEPDAGFGPTDLADAIDDGLFGFDVGFVPATTTTDSPGIESSTISAWPEIRGALRLRGSTDGLTVTVEEKVTTTAGGYERPDVSMTLTPGGWVRVAGDDREWLADAELGMQADIAGLRMDTGDRGFGFSAALPMARDGTAGERVGQLTYDFSLPDLSVDIAPALGEAAGVFGMELRPIDLSITGDGIGDEAVVRVTSNAGLLFNRPEILADMTFGATAVLRGTVSAGQADLTWEECPLISIAALEVPESLRLRDSLDLCLDIVTPGNGMVLVNRPPYLASERITVAVGSPSGEPLSPVLVDPVRGRRLVSATIPGFQIALEPTPGENWGSPVGRLTVSGVAIDPASAYGRGENLSFQGDVTMAGVEGDLSGRVLTDLLGRRETYQMRASVSSHDGGSGTLAVTGPSGVPSISANITRRREDGRVHANWRLAQITLSGVDNLEERLSAMTGFSVSEPEGRVTARGTATWDGQLRTAGHIDLRDVGFATPFFRLAGLTTEFRVDRFQPPAIPCGQRATISTLDLGFVLENGRFDFGVCNDTVRVDNLEFAWAGGTVAAEPIATRLDDRERTIILDVQSVGLSELFQDLPLDDLEISGTVSGRIPLRLTMDTVHIDNGVLYSDAPGRIRYGTGRPPGDMDADGGLEILFQALEDFRYEELTMTLDGQTGYNLELGLLIEGANPELYGGYPVRLNVGVSGALDDILRRSLETTRIGQDLETLLRLDSEGIDEDAIMRQLRSMER